jgi:hypothetical protein
MYRQLEAFFAQHDEERLGEIDLIIDSYRGRMCPPQHPPSPVDYHHCAMITTRFIIQCITTEQDYCKLPSVSSYSSGEHEIMRDVRSEYGLTRTPSFDVWVEGVGTINDVPPAALRRPPTKHNHGARLVAGDEVIVDLKHGKTARGVVRGSGRGQRPDGGGGIARRPAPEASPEVGATSSTGGSPVGYATLSAAALAEGSPSGGGRPLAAPRLVGMMAAFQADVRRLASEKARLAAAERRRASQAAQLDAEREALRVAVAQTRQLRAAEEAGLKAERARLEEAIRINEAERVADAARLSEERLVLQHAVRHARGCKGKQERRIDGADALLSLSFSVSLFLFQFFLVHLTTLTR